MKVVSFAARNLQAAPKACCFGSTCSHKGSGVKFGELYGGSTLTLDHKAPSTAIPITLGFNQNQLDQILKTAKAITEAFTGKILR